jgi:transcriptional regulator GlxA family with amidase domain
MRLNMFLSLLTAALPMAALAQDVRPKIPNPAAVPKHYGILVAPSITPIDMFGPLDVFTAIAMYYMNETGPMQLSILTATDPATTNPPVQGLDNFGVKLWSTVTTSNYLSLAASNFSATANKGGPTSPIEVLLVPGGGGTRGNVSAEVAFVKTVYPSLKYLISVCTGSTIIARAGVLDNQKATTNKKAWAWASSFGKNVTYVPAARWVQDGNIYTGSGVSAAVDTAYAFVTDVYGDKVSQWIADASEYTRWKDAHYDPFAERWGLVNKTASG